MLQWCFYVQVATHQKGPSSPYQMSQPTPSRDRAAVIIDTSIYVPTLLM